MRCKNFSEENGDNPRKASPNARPPKKERH